jgi:glutamate synthase domain-containing protein 2
MVRAGADIIVLDGIRGATGAAPKVIRDNVGIPIELALASVDQRLRDEGIRNKASIIISGDQKQRRRCEGHCLGADAVYIGTAALWPWAVQLCQKCYTGKCPWGIATTDPWISKRLRPRHCHEETCQPPSSLEP